MFLRPLAVFIFALFQGVLTFSASSYAQSSKSEIQKPFGISISASRTRSFYDHQDGTLRESNDYEFLPSYTWRHGKTLVAVTYSEDLRAEDNNSSDIGDIAVINAFKGWDLPKIKLSPSVTVVLPQSKDSRLRKSLQTAVAGKLTASIQERLLIPGFAFATALSVGRNFHRYETDLEGESNNQYTSRQSLMSSYSWGIFSLSLELHHINAWTYQGSLKEAYEHYEEVSVAAGDHFGFALGHTNAGSVFKANGYESNYQLIDENNSLVYAKVSLQY